MILKTVMGLLRAKKDEKMAQVRKGCIEIIPAMYKSIQEFKGENLDLAIKEILEFIRIPNNKDRGTGFVSMGKMSSMVPSKEFEQYIDPILKLIHEEVRVPAKTREGIIKLTADLESLTCMKYMLRNFGPQCKQKIDVYALINDIFYTGYNR
jgi:hypothetical protein